MKRVLIIILSVLVITSGCHKLDKGGVEQDGANQQVEEKLAGELPWNKAQQSGGEKVAGIPIKLLEKSNLHVEWVIQKLAMGRGEKIRRFYFHNDMLLVLDDQSELHALSGRDGLPLWNTTLSRLHGDISEPEFYKDRLLFVVANEIVELRGEDGVITRRTGLKFPPSTTAARSEEYLFIGSSNNHFYCLRLEDGITLWHSSQPSRPVGKVRVLDDKVYFTDREGVLYVSNTYRRKLLWHKKTAGETLGVLISEDGGQCYLPSTDTSLYCLDPQTGEEQWRYLAGGRLVELPVLTERFVYQGVEQSVLLCLERDPVSKAGSLRWELENGRQVLAEDGELTYVITRDNKLAIMNNSTGKRELSFFVPGMELYATNTKSAMIYMADRDGMIVALSPNE